MSRRYIDADKFVANLATDHWGITNMTEVGIALDKAVVDVVEVRHGEWETIPDYSHPLTTYCHICSECKTVYKDVRPHGHNYCHICGAKMSGERSEQ